MKISEIFISIPTLAVCLCEDHSRLHIIVIFISKLYYDIFTVLKVFQLKSKFCFRHPIFNFNIYKVLIIILSNKEVTIIFSKPKKLLSSSFEVILAQNFSKNSEYCKIKTKWSSQRPPASVSIILHKSTLCKLLNVR